MKGQFKTIFEPFKIKVVEPIRITSRSERQRYLQQAHYNLFLLSSDQVIIDLLTDSGTSAQSEAQWAGIMQGDESYAGSTSWKHFYETVKDLTGYPYVLPVHQGRGAESVLFEVLCRKGAKYFFSNTHFDTTRANIEYRGATAIDLPCEESQDLFSDAPFKGNIHLQELKKQVEKVGVDNVGAVILTLTNNSGGGQPVSFQNIQETAQFCKEKGIRFFIDACRIAENCYFIHTREEGFSHLSCWEIAQKIFSLADGCLVSAKKDFFGNIGGFLALKDEALAQECMQYLIITEGFLTYGGLAGRDLEAIAVGIREAFDMDYLRYRIRALQYFNEKLRAIGIPVVYPPGGHAVYIDAQKYLPHIPKEHFPGQSLCCALYIEGGIRAVEIGSVMFGKNAKHELVRLAFPRRAYTQAHVDYVIEVFSHINAIKEQLPGYRIVYQMPFLRHFTAHFEPIKG